MDQRMAPTRYQAIARMRRRLERDGWPRLQMMLLVTITGGAGFVASWALLQLGVGAMWLRYPLALCLAYAAFLLMLWLWLRTRAHDWVDGWDGSGIDLATSPGTGGSAPWGGLGGNSGGGGASSSFDAADSSPADALSGPIGDALGAAADADELAIPMVAVVVAVAVVALLALSSLFVVWSAPVLFAELLVDGALAAGLYRRLRGIDARHWLESAVRRTWLPFVLTALCVTAAGWGMAKYVPGADSLGDVVAQVQRD
ncbi:hypothetical protein ACFQZQ_10025 [Lysobacter koreensis]|uniref:Transmembrane protein n=1 Tax=Lysobacter koreensis TaxID=266122 RepID=A0ABW2YPN4_9GAMM